MSEETQISDEELAGYDSDDSIPMDPELLAIMQEIENEHTTTEEDEMADLPKQQDPRSRKLKYVLKEWGMGSSCHGVPHMSEAHTCLVIILWTIVLLVCLGTFAWLFYDNITQYLGFGNIVMLKVGLDEINFPAVTICNINPYKLEAIDGQPELQALLIVYERAANGVRG